MNEQDNELKNDNPKGDWIDRIADWLDGNHISSRIFCYTFKGLIAMIGIVACIILYYFFNNDQFRNFRSFNENKYVE